MENNKYYKGFEGEGCIEIWTDQNRMIIWEGYFNTILEGCYQPDYSPDGILKCYVNQDGFFDDIWEMQHPLIVLEELKRFDENCLNTTDHNLIRESKEIIEELTSFIIQAVNYGEKIYIEYT